MGASGLAKEMALRRKEGEVMTTVVAEQHRARSTPSKISLLGERCEGSEDRVQGLILALPTPVEGRK